MLNCNSEETQRPQPQPVDVVTERREFDEIPQDVLIFLIWEVLWQMMHIDSEPNLLRRIGQSWDGGCKHSRFSQFVTNNLL
jgi:hypothetical protein